MKRVALVTGGSRGIGLGIATQLAKAGFQLCVNGVRDEGEVSGVIKELKSHGVDVIYCQGDISSAKDRESILEQAKKHFGSLHVLVNNAGIAPKERRDILEATEESFDRLINTNLKGTYFLTQAAARWMVEQKKSDKNFDGSIVIVSSISATVASVNRGEYCVSKAGLAMTAQLFASRLGAFGIPVYEVRPGVIDTDMTSATKEKYDKLIAEGLTVAGRWGYPDDVGKAVASLVSGNFPYSTGQVLMVDGGLTISRL